MGEPTAKPTMATTDVAPEPTDDAPTSRRPFKTSINVWAYSGKYNAANTQRIADSNPIPTPTVTAFGTSTQTVIVVILALWPHRFRLNVTALMMLDTGWISFHFA